MIEARHLTKHYGAKVAVDDLSFTVRPGVVTGFLGPNGAGKSTTMRLIVGLDRPTAGTVTVNGRPYVAHPDPLCQVGVLLEAKAVHTSRSARNHLLALAATHGFSRRRVEELIELVGLTEVAGRRAGAFSLGMGQRLGIASALLGDPAVLVLDEPVNGLDPEGVRWVRDLLKAQAAEGRTVFVSSHLMSEMALTADHVIVIGRGRLLADEPVAELIRGASAKRVVVRTPDAARFVPVLTALGATVHATDHATDHEVFEVIGLSAPEVGAAAQHHGVQLHELTPQHASLEEVFMEMTSDTVEYRTGAGPAGRRPSQEAVG